MKKFIITLIAVIILFKIILSILAYHGDNSAELYNDLLKYFSQGDIIKGETYARSGFLVSVINSLILPLFMLILAFTPLSKKIEDLCFSITREKYFLSSILYIVIIYSVLTIIMLPFNFYLSYILEHRFGFSNMTLQFWLITRLKSFIIALLFISLMGTLFLAAIKKFRIYSLFIVPVAGLVIGLFMILIYPIAILPIFYDIKSIDNPSLEREIRTLTQKANIKIDNIYIINASDYSKHTNAFFVGFGTNKKIYLYDTLLKDNSEPEIISILAHEIGHWVYDHNLKGIILGFILYLSVFTAIYFCVKKYLIESDRPSEHIHYPSMIPIYLLFFIIFSSITNPIEMIVSRGMETNADIYSLNITDDPDTFISSNIKLAKNNSSRLNVNKIAAFFRRSHPTTIERIKLGERYKGD